ncbi:hypothetical protein TrST_g3803 [Triparma strigata]|uniref:CXXC-type domain-containing protein n=1 Tax=Triparma strigata TaxID=1606541 RepID=A0A9W7BM56_9STRA|nr:hypothetical protein TrST_g3803 [Triparma strigata]
MADAYWLDDSSSAADDNSNSEMGISCLTCGASTFYSEGGQMFCSSCFTQSQGQSQVMEEDDAANLGARSSRGGLVRAQTPKTRKRKVVDDRRVLPKIDLALQYLFDAVEVLTKEAVRVAASKTLAPASESSERSVIAIKLSTQILALYLRAFKAECGRHPTSKFNVIEAFLQERTIAVLNAKRGGEAKTETLYELTSKSRKNRGKASSDLLSLVPSLEVLVSITALTLTHLNYGVSLPILYLWISQHRVPYRNLGSRIRVSNKFLVNFFSPRLYPDVESLRGAFEVLKEVFYRPMAAGERDGILSGNAKALAKRIGAVLNLDGQVVSRYEVLKDLLDGKGNVSFDSSDHLSTTSLLLIGWKMLRLDSEIVYETNLYDHPTLNSVENANKSVLNGRSYDIFEEKLGTLESESKCEEDLIKSVNALRKKNIDREKKSAVKVERNRVLAWTEDCLGGRGESELENVMRSNLSALASGERYYIKFEGGLDSLPITFKKLILEAAKLAEVRAEELWSSVQNLDLIIEELVTGRKAAVEEPEKGKRVRATQCGKCVGCLTPDCGQCIYCLDSVKFGGPKILKQKCKLRTCLGEPAKEQNKVRATACGNCFGCLTPDCGQCIYCLDSVKFGGPGIKRQRCKQRTCHVGRSKERTRVRKERRKEEDPPEKIAAEKNASWGVKCAVCGSVIVQNVDKFFTRTELARKYPRCKNCAKERRDKCENVKAEINVFAPKGLNNNMK